MRKTLLIGTVAVFILWTVIDILIHGILLMPTYQATASLWRPPEEMLQGVLHLVTLISALFFTALYLLGFADGGMQRSLLFGVYFGLAVGVSMGFGTYSVQPIPMNLAVGWLLGTLAEAIVGALVLHWASRRFIGASA